MIHDFSEHNLYAYTIDLFAVARKRENIATAWQKVEIFVDSLLPNG